MTSLFRSAWSGLISPMIKRPPALQLAALCWREGSEGREVLLVTSSSGRWILPKGWPVDGLTAPETALQEAWEEAGVKRGQAAPDALGEFGSRKRFDTGVEIACDTKVFEVEVLEDSTDYPESAQRQRRWVKVGEAANSVDEPGLVPLLEDYAARF